MVVNITENKQYRKFETIEELQNFNYEEFCNIDKNEALGSVSELQMYLNQEDNILVDVRNTDEQPKIRLSKRMEILLHTLEERICELKIYKTICFVCASGIRSKKALEIVKQHYPEKELKHFSPG